MGFLATVFGINTERQREREESTLSLQIMRVKNHFQVHMSGRNKISKFYKKKTASHGIPEPSVYQCPARNKKSHLKNFELFKSFLD